MQSKFRGALLGVLVGDCVGAFYEGKQVNALELVEKIESIKSEQKILKYTDDTAMTKSICKSLIANKGIDPKHLAQEFSESYFKEPDRGYGAAVRQVFVQLRDTQYKDPYGPASRQFNGSGSFGNGAAMRCCGIALFAHNNKLDDNQTLILTESCSKITHSHRYGIHGALLLVTAVRYILSINNDSLDDGEFLNYLIKKMRSIEDQSKDYVFTQKLESIQKVIEQLSINGADTTQREIVELLGNDVSAQNSVPLAIYSFLRGNSKFTDSYKYENEFLRTLHWAISCGGDTDTIASMACSLSGAYLGCDKIPMDLYKKCESWSELVRYADQLSK